MSLTKQACSFVQVGLQSSGYHTSTTFFFPAKSESFTSFLSWFCSAKSGAVCPTAIAIFFPPINLDSMPPSYRILHSRAKRQRRFRPPPRRIFWGTLLPENLPDDQTIFSEGTPPAPMIPLPELVAPSLSVAVRFG